MGVYWSSSPVSASFPVSCRFLAETGRIELIKIPKKVLKNYIKMTLKKLEAKKPLVIVEKILGRSPERFFPFDNTSFILAAVFQICCSFHICLGVSMYICLSQCIPFERRCGRSASFSQVFG